MKDRGKVAEEYEKRRRREGGDHESKKGDPPVEQELN